VDYENEEGKEEGEEEDVVVVVAVECRGSKRDCTTFETSHFFMMRRDWGLLLVRVFLTHHFFFRGGV
jgi:hypothetical protein